VGAELLVNPRVDHYGRYVMKAYEVLIVEPRKPWLRWRRLAPRWLRYSAAVRSPDVTVAEAEWRWRREFGAARPAGTLVSCRGLEEPPPALVPHGIAAGPNEELVSYDRGHRFRTTGSLQLHAEIQAASLPGDGSEGSGVREPLRPKPGSGAAGTTG
jgi:hypothetical protein